jgi:hypothetical protein
VIERLRRPGPATDVAGMESRFELARTGADMRRGFLQDDEGTPTWVDLRVQAYLEVERARTAHLGRRLQTTERWSPLSSAEASHIVHAWARALRVPADIAEEIHTDLRFVLSAAVVASTDRAASIARELSFFDDMFAAYQHGAMPLNVHEGKLVVAAFDGSIERLF